ncbi:MAG: LacI family transcriptional regulator [Clostridiales bacterium]|nr:LacI family transcriptional regulator [Clostridiales bacterium]
MAKKLRVTIKDVARVAGVTPQTVSRAFRNAEDINKETKERILQIASEMGYVQNASARSLRNGSSKLIAIIYDNIMNSYFSIITYYLQDYLRGKGYSILSISVTDNVLKERDYLTALEHNAEGVISFLQADENIARLINTYRVPVLVMGRRSEDEGVDSVYVDDVEVGKIAARRFIEKGCKNPLCISEAMDITCAYDRCLGFKEEFKGVGVEVRLIARERPGEDLPLEERLLQAYKSNPPDAIFCFNDIFAFQALYVIEKHGLKIPLIIGVDNIQQEIFLPKRLTTVGWDKRKLAQISANAILSRISGSEEKLFSVKEEVFLVEGVTA